MRTIDNHNALQTYKEYAKPNPAKAAKMLARKSMVEPVLGEQFEDDTNMYQIPVSKEVENWQKQQLVDSADLGDNFDDERDDDLDHDRDEVDNPGFTVRDYTEEDDGIDELPEDAEVGEPDEEDVVDEEAEEKES